MRKIVVYIIMCGLFSSCATSVYRQADLALDQGSSQRALKEYLRIIHEDKRRNGTYTDVRALLGAAAAYYQLQKYRNTQKMCKWILKIDSRHGGALFYAGSSLEAMGKKEVAFKFYRQYARLNSNDPFRPFLEARYNKFLNQALAQKMRAAIRRERSINVDKIPDNTIAVLYFVNSDRSVEGDAISKGLAELMTSDLMNVRQLRVIERIRLNILLNELQISPSELTDPNTITRIGKLLHVRTLVNGAFTLAGSDIHITMNLTDVTGTKSFDVGKYYGQFENIMSVEKDVVNGILEQLRIQLSYSDQDKLLKVSTKNFQAFMAFCYGIDLMDQERYSSAISNLKKAVEFDPYFQVAQQKYQLITAMNAASDEASILNIVYAAEKRAAQRQGGTAAFAHSRMPLTVGSEGRLNRMSYHLDLGVIPGKESRQDAAELQMNGVSVKRRKLPEPPPPPVTP